MPTPDISPDIMAKILLSAAVLGGTALCFFGLRLFKIAFGIAGLAAGALLAAYFGWRFSTPPEVVALAKTYPDVLDAILHADNKAVIYVWAVSGGIAGGLLSAFLQQVGVFVLGAWLGQLAASLSMANATAQSYWMVVAILGLIGGVLALVMRKSIIVLSTGMNGATALMFGIYSLIKDVTPKQALVELRKFGNDAWVMLGCAAILAFVGCYVQFTTAPDEKHEEEIYKKVKPKRSSGSD
jgi:uncharacterized protein DUF4203